VPSLINQVPPGLLSLLGIKALGVNPSILPDELSPSLDLFTLYIAGNSIERRSTTAAIGTTGFFSAAALIVPAGELWLVEAFSIDLSAVVGAATTYRLKPAYFNVGTNALFAVGASASATTGDRLNAKADDWFYLPSNYQPGVYCEQVTPGVPQTCNIAFRYVPLKL